MGVAGKVFVDEYVAEEKDDQDDAQSKDGSAGDEADANERPEFAHAIDDERPDEIELLFYLERPEVARVEEAEVEWDISCPKDEIGGVGEEVVLPAVPD